MYFECTEQTFGIIIAINYLQRYFIRILHYSLFIKISIILSLSITRLSLQMPRKSIDEECFLIK